MKTMQMFCMILLASFGFVTAQIVTDGSFEDPYNFVENWDPYIGPDAVDAALEIVEDETARTGDFMLRMVGSAADGDDPWVGPAQMLSLEPFTDYVLTMYIKGENPYWSNNPLWANAYLGVFDESAGKDLGYDDMNEDSQCQDHDPGELVFGCGDMTDWLEIVYHFGTLENTEVELWFGVWIDINPEFFVDDVSIEKATGVDNRRTSLPEGYGLNQNYPNPFNPSTTISFSLPESRHVRLSIYDVSGQLIKSLVSERLDEGSYSVSWNGVNLSGKPVSAGLYLYKLEAGNYSESMKMIFMK